MERLESFVAGSLLKRLQPADGAVPEARCAAFRGAVALRRHLRLHRAGRNALRAGRGRRRAARRNRSTRAFRSHVRAVHDNGGEIACFAGDAFVAYWPADDGNVPRALRQGNDCARALHAPHVAAPTRRRRRRRRCTLASAPARLWAARLGAGRRWQLLLAGPAVRHACAASARAAPGETVVAPAGRTFHGVVGHDSAADVVADPPRCLDDAPTTLS